MIRDSERSVQELYSDDPERADAEVFGRKTGVDRRGFLGGTGLAAMGVALGGAIPFAANMPGGLIPAAYAQTAGPPTPPRSSSPTRSTSGCREDSSAWERPRPSRC